MNWVVGLTEVQEEEEEGVPCFWTTIYLSRRDDVRRWRSFRPMMSNAMMTMSTKPTMMNTTTT